LFGLLEQAPTLMITQGYGGPPPGAGYGYAPQPHYPGGGFNPY